MILLEYKHKILNGERGDTFLDYILKRVGQSIIHDGDYPLHICASCMGSG